MIDSIPQNYTKDEILMLMSSALKEWELRAWDGDPRRRDDDQMCKKARYLIGLVDQLNTIDDG
jgi:hypothetical protein